MAKPKKSKKKVCALCGATLGETYIYSRFTKSRYCPNMMACDERRRKKKADIKV